MPTNEEGEFELILGNRQLLSVFFIVVILLGIFFTMGYIVGQHSTPLVAAETSPKAGSAKPVAVEPPGDTSREPEPEQAKAPKQEPPPAKPEPVRTAPQQPAETAKAEPPKSEPKSAKAEKPAPAKKGEVVPPTPSSSQPAGTYLQLAATTKREADIMVDVLRQKRFTAMAAEIPEKPGLFRVLVGPVSDAQVNKTKTDLQSAGFPGDKSIKRTF